VLWFTHPQDSTLLRVATRVSKAVLTVDERSFPFASPKVRAIGHGVDVSRFACRDAPDRHPLRALALGRFSQVKNYELIQRAVDRVEGMEVDFVGPGDSAGLRNARPPVPWTEVPELFGAYDLFVSATKAGSADKVVFEAGASCLPVLASSPALASFLPEELRFATEDELVARLETLKSADRGALGRELRERVVHDHSVEHWADEVLRAL
jgi:glycosyltransferase involved in cell wall biosynthesis